MAIGAVGADAGFEQQIAARIERLPLSAWHLRSGAILGTAFFFDGFDALVIAYVLPVLIPLWHLRPAEIGLLISAGYLGQTGGSLFFGWLAEKIGRVRALTLTVLVYTLMSLVCIFAWSFTSMLWLRLLQGIGLGGEVPVAATYVNEFAPAERRGRLSLSCQFLFALGLTVVALVGVWVVPHLGWRALFVIGAVPAVIAVPMRRLLPESPRWLAGRGRTAEASRVLAGIEAEISANGSRPLPPLPADRPAVARADTRLSDLFRGIYRRRTLSLWVMWICTYLITYGLAGWLPSIYRTVYHLSVQQALTYGFVASLAGLVGGLASLLLIDVVGRKRLFAAGQLLSAVPLLILAHNPAIAPHTVLLLVTLAFTFNTVLALGLATYTAESYPTELRALGSGIAGAWQRLASVVGPILIGAILPAAGLGAVFGVFGAIAVLGGLVALVFSVETKSRVLERVSPSL